MRFLINLFNIFNFNDKLKTLGIPRSRYWREVRKKHLEKEPFCAVCGNSKNVVPHHIIPFHVDPSKELDSYNLITLCEGDTFNCHLFFGHLKNWSKYNENVVEDSKFWNKKINNILQ